jgi:hypothetical protein
MFQANLFFTLREGVTDPDGHLLAVLGGKQAAYLRGWSRALALGIE